jgi:hypothetical protein
LSIASVFLSFGSLLLRVRLGLAATRAEVVVVDELVAGVDQQVRGRALHAAADHPLVVLLELGDQRREVAVAGQQREDVDVLLGVAEVERVDHHVDVGAVLAAVPALRDVDHLDALAWNSRV